MGAMQDKVALVTGASSGLGAETARLLSRQGATVFGLGRDSGRLGDVFAEVERGAYASVDIASAQACRDAVERCVRESVCLRDIVGRSHRQYGNGNATSE